MLQCIPILLFATVGLFLVLYIHHSWGLVGTVLARSQVARHTMRSTMLTSWVLLLWMMVQFYTATKAMADTIQEERLFTLFKDVYTPQVTTAYVQWGSFLAILFLEAPILCIFFFLKATDLHNRRQQFSKTNCRLCYWITVLCDTLGSIGVVAAVQIASVYLFYCALYLTVSIAITVLDISHTVAHIGTVLLFFVLLQQLATTGCSKCSILFKTGMKCLALWLLGLLYLGISIQFKLEIDPDTQYKSSVGEGVLRSLVTSAIIGIYGYVVRKMYQKMKKEVKRAVKEEQALAPLIERGQSMS